MTRQRSEEARLTDETGRKRHETQRDHGEDTRVERELARDVQEKGREVAEQAREFDEMLRVRAEGTPPSGIQLSEARRSHRGIAAESTGHRFPTSLPGVMIRVLVVEDDAGVRKVVVRMLQEAGYEVLEAADCHAGQAQVQGWSWRRRPARPIRVSPSC